MRTGASSRGSSPRLTRDGRRDPRFGWAQVRAIRGCRRFASGATLRTAEEGLRPFPTDTVRTTVTAHPRTGGVPLRRLAAAILAAPVIASIYIATLWAVPFAGDFRNTSRRMRGSGAFCGHAA